jgi:hypothetical protein
MTRSFRHGRACPGHPRLSGSNEARAWMPGTRPGMTHRRKACLKPSPIRAGGALGEQVPGSVDEGGKNNEGKREQRHETSVPSGAKKISTSPPLGFCPSGAAACYRGFRNARTGDGGFAIRNPSCHSVDGTLISPGIRWGQSDNLVLQVRNARVRPPDPATAVRNLGPGPCAPSA